MPWSQWLPMYASAIIIAAFVGWFTLSLAVSGLGTAHQLPGYALRNDTVLTVFQGEAIIHRPNGFTIRVVPGAAHDALIYPGDRIETGTGSFAFLTYFDGSTTEIEQNTVLSVRRIDRRPSGAADVSFAQQQGQTWNRVERLKDSDGATLPSSAGLVHGGGPYLLRVNPDGAAPVDLAGDDR